MLPKSTKHAAPSSVTRAMDDTQRHQSVEAIASIEATVSTIVIEAIEASHQSPPLDPLQAYFLCFSASAVSSDTGESFISFTINFSQDNPSTRTPSILSTRSLSLFLSFSSKEGGGDMSAKGRKELEGYRFVKKRHVKLRTKGKRQHHVKGACLRSSQSTSVAFKPWSHQWHSSQ